MIRSASAAWLVTALCVTQGAAAQSNRTRGGARVPAPSLSASTLRTHLGIDVAEALLSDSSPEQRQRGFERLGSIGTAQSLDLLLKVFETGGAARSARDRLIAVRALSAHANVPAVRDFLVRIMVGVGSNPGHSEAIDGMIERAAALSLARAGDDASLSMLGKALRQSGHVAETASDALLAYPPKHLEPLVQGIRSPTRTLAQTLGALGDRRAIPALREIVRSAPHDVRPEAALALAKLGVTETEELARHWLEHEQDPAFRSAAARILLELHSKYAAAAIATLLAEERTQAAGLELASEAALPELATPLLKGAKSAAPSERSAWFAALGRMGTREAFSFLGGALGTRDSSSAAALSLALSPDTQAEAELERGMSNASTRRAALRAALVRRVALDRTPSGFSSALRELSASRDGSDRALFAQLSALSAPARGAELVAHAAPVELRALSRLAKLPEMAMALADRLAVEPDPALREALAACLSSLSAAERVPSNVLLDLLEARGLAAPLAARALGARDSRVLRPKILAWLESDDPLLRSHTALGLAQSTDGSALGVLERAYRFETDPSVRLAIVRGLGTRHEAARLRVLELARTQDAASDVRLAAARALAGSAVDATDSGPQTAWLELRLGGGEPTTGTVTRGALLIGADGLALPAFADPDGVLLLPALPSGPFELRLAAPTRTDDSAKTK